MSLSSERKAMRDGIGRMEPIVGAPAPISSSSDTWPTNPVVTALRDAAGYYAAGEYGGHDSGLRAQILNELADKIERAEPVTREAEPDEERRIEGWAREGSGSPYHDGVDWRIWEGDEPPIRTGTFTRATLILRTSEPVTTPLENTMLDGNDELT